jgi:limonene-1,2-epoxide hydrolase
MSADDRSLPNRLRDALLRLTPDRPDAVDALRELYAEDIVFRDPIQVVRGIDDFVAMNHRLLRRMRTLEWTVVRARGDDSEAFLEWTMHGATKLGIKVTVEGITRARARDGRIIDHRDYWDLGELLASTIPRGQRILHTLLSPFA